MRDQAVCYITRARRGILVLEPAGDSEEPGVRVPACAVAPGETPAAAAVREAREGMGVTGLSTPELLGVRTHHVVRDGRRGVERRFFFWLEASPHPPDAWTHRIPDGALEGGATLRLRFAAIDAASIAWGMDALVPRLRERLSCENVAVCYITRGGEILVFEGHPGGGVQVVAGRLEAGETSAQAAVREAFEEAGLRISQGRFLGTQEWHHRGVTDVHEFRHYFWFQVPSTMPDAWSHRVSAGDADTGRVFRHRFVPVASASIDWDLDAHLPPLVSPLP